MGNVNLPKLDDQRDYKETKANQNHIKNEKDLKPKAEKNMKSNSEPLSRISKLLTNTTSSGFST